MLFIAMTSPPTPLLREGEGSFVDRIYYIGKVIHSLLVCAYDRVPPLLHRGEGVRG